MTAAIEPLPPRPPWAAPPKDDVIPPDIDSPIEVATELATEAATAPTTNEDTVVWRADATRLTFAGGGVDAPCGGGLVMTIGRDVETVEVFVERGVPEEERGVPEVLGGSGAGVVAGAG